jgi:hypothetical protein
MRFRRGLFRAEGSMREGLRRLTSSWPPPMRVALKRYLRSHSVQPLNMTEGRPPHYILFSIWLLRRFKPKPSGSDRRFLANVLWGQFCLYLAFRIQDDQLDHDSGPGWLILVTDLLQLEAVRTFSLYFPRDSRFWTLYFESIESTIQGVVRVDSLQRCRDGNVSALLKGYTRVCAFFAIGAAAVCVRFSRMKDFQRALMFWNEMAIAGQLLDDLEDLSEDWHRGRFNSAVKIVLRNNLSASGGKCVALSTVKRALAAGGVDRIAQMVLRRIDRAEEALRPIRGRSLYPGFRDYRMNIERMRRAMHRESVLMFFPGIMSPGSDRYRHGVIR